MLTIVLIACVIANHPWDKLHTVSYSYQEYPLERNGVKLHLDSVVADNSKPLKSILLIHGVTYSSHEFDIYLWQMKALGLVLVSDIRQE